MFVLQGVELLGSHISCPFCQKASPEGRFPATGPVDVIRLTFKGAGRGRGFVVTDRSSALDDPSVCEPLASRVLQVVAALMEHGYVMERDFPGVGDLIEWAHGSAEWEQDWTKQEFLLKDEIDDLRRQYKALVSAFDEQSLIIDRYETQNRLRAFAAKSARRRETRAPSKVDTLVVQTLWDLSEGFRTVSGRLEQVLQASHTFEDALERLADDPSSELRGVNATELREKVREYQSRVNSIVGEQQPKAGSSKFTLPETSVRKSPTDGDAKAGEPYPDAARAGSDQRPIEVLQQGQRELAVLLGKPVAAESGDLEGMARAIVEITRS